MHTFIDGYNVTRSDPATRDLPLEEQRARLEARMRSRGAALIGSGGYTIVWDGAGGKGVVHDEGPSVDYTRRPTADDSIVERVRASKSRVCVVTSDNELANRCRSVAGYGADICPSNRLFESAETTRSAKGRSKGPARRDMGIPANANEINAELKKLWGIDN